MSSDLLAELFDLADAMTLKAYAPYSDFPVGAAIRTASGNLYGGCNIENAAYPNGLCAEASAIAVMVASGETNITDIAIVGVKANPCHPCGACRQRLSEFSDAATKVHILDATTSQIVTYSIDELLPKAFGPRDLAG